MLLKNSVVNVIGLKSQGKVISIRSSYKEVIRLILINLDARSKLLDG